MQADPAPGAGQPYSSRRAPVAIVSPSSPKPLCTSCAYPTPYIYTTYTSASNIRLGVCPRCDSFLDSLIESPALVLALDLVLLKPRVFLHLLFNRGCPPQDASGAVSLPDEKSTPSSYDRSRRIWTNISYLSLAIVLAEVAVRRPHPTDIPYSAGRIVFEIGAQLVASTAVALLFLRFSKWYPPTIEKEDCIPAVSTRDGRQEGFLPSLVPLVLLYTSLLPLLLQLVLGIWYDGPVTSAPIIRAATLWSELDVPSYIGSSLRPLAVQVHNSIAHTVEHMSLLWHDVDRVWAGTRVLGGMSAGFGLRVLLPTKPWQTTSIVMAGWGAALIAGKMWDTMWHTMMS